MNQFRIWIVNLFKLFTKKQKRTFYSLVVLMILAAIMETIATALMLPLMNVMISNSTFSDSKIMIFLFAIIGSNETHLFLLRMTLIIAGVYLIKGILAFFNNYLQQRFVANNRRSLAKLLFDAFLDKSYGFHLMSSTADMQRAVITDVDWYCFFINSFMTLLAEGFILCIMFIALLIMDPIITIMAVVLLFGSMLLITCVVSGKVRTAGEKNRLQSVEMLKWVQQTIGGLKNILVNYRKKYFSNNFMKSVNSYSKYNCQYQTVFALPRIIMETVSMVGIFLMMAVLLFFKSDVEALLPMLATFAIAAVRLIPSAKRISDSINQMKYYGPSLENIFLTLEDKDCRHVSDKITHCNIQSSNMDELNADSIDICDITFAFEDAEKPLYSDFSLSLPLNKSIAFIGSTGSGKTTLADIILGLHQPQKGSVKVGNRNILENKEWWSKQIGYIPQSIYLCDDTIRSNVAFGYSTEEIDDKKVWKALKEAQLDEYIRDLPQGINTVTGENGIRLSGGQRQRIGIARALYTNPKILVLDEATSALDNDTEKAIMDSINYLSKEKTLIIIAHRLSTTEKCDLIYKIEFGKAELIKS